jgi:hypothetical protein
MMNPTTGCGGFVVFINHDFKIMISADKFW